MQLLAHESSHRDKAIDAASAVRIDPLRKGWWQTMWREFILLKLERLSVLSPSCTSESWRLHLVYQPTWQHTSCGKTFTLASYQQVGHTPPACNTMGPQCHSETFAPDPKVPFAYALCFSHPVIHPIQRKLITHVLQTDDSPIILTSLSPTQVIHHHSDFPSSICCSSTNWIQLSTPASLQKTHRGTPYHITLLFFSAWHLSSGHFLTYLLYCFFHAFPHENVISMKAGTCCVLFTTICQFPAVPHTLWEINKYFWKDELSNEWISPYISRESPLHIKARGKNISTNVHSLVWSCHFRVCKWL